MARLLAAGAALAVVAFGAAFLISHAASRGAPAAPKTAANRATTVQAPAKDVALADSFSGQLVSLKLAPAPQLHRRKPAKHHPAAGASSAIAASSTSTTTTSASPSSAAQSSSLAQSSAPASSASSGTGSSGGGSSASGSSHHTGHHHGGTGSGTTTIP